MSILNDIYSNLVPFTLLLGILVFVHELGHFLVARACGVRVEVFSLGFGKKIFSFKKGDTTYCISLIPLGGYVKMFGEHTVDEVKDEEKSVSFTHKTVWQRMAIVLAGPLMNLFFAVLVFAFIAVYGEQTRSAKIAEIETNSVADKSGLKSMDHILTVNDQKIRSYEEFQLALNQNKKGTISLKVQQENEESRIVKVDVKAIPNPNIFSLEKEIGQIEGLLPYAKGSLVAIIKNSILYNSGVRTGDEIVRINNMKVNSWKDLSKLTAIGQFEIIIERNTDDNSNQKSKMTFQINNEKVFENLTDLGIDNSELYLEQIIANSPAAKVELKKYDKLISIDGVIMTNWENVLSTIKNYSGQKPLEFTILRDGEELKKSITPQVTSQMTMMGKEDKRYTIGILPLSNLNQPEIVTVRESNIFAAIQKGWNRSYDISVMTAMSFVRLIQGEVSHKNIGGMISIGKAAKDSFAMGLQSFLMTMGILSISLFILNLLPVPVLDGGHLVFYIIEAVKGSPLSGKKLEIAHQVGFALLIGLMLLSFFNDITKFIFKI